MSDQLEYGFHEEDPENWPEDRVDIISPNGNDGLHYDEVKEENGKEDSWSSATE